MADANDPLGFWDQPFVEVEADALAKACEFYIRAERSWRLEQSRWEPYQNLESADQTKLFLAAPGRGYNGVEVKPTKAVIEMVRANAEQALDIAKKSRETARIALLEHLSVGVR